MKKQNLLKSVFVTIVMLFGTGAFAQTQVANIAEFNALPENEMATITGEVTVTHDQGSNVFFQDETGWLLMYASGRVAELNSGDKVTGLTGEFVLYVYDRADPTATTLPEMMYYGDPFTVVAGTAPATPFPMNPTSVIFADYNRFVVFENVEMEGDVDYLAYPGAASDGYIITDNGPMIVRNHWRLWDKSFKAGDKVNAKGIIRSYNGAIQMYLTDIELAGESAINDKTADGCKVTGYFNLLGQQLNDKPAKGAYIETYSNCPAQKLIK
ncbi:MAG: hypothetical protein LBR75_02595 [Prevotellaceae bacterium]|jgi:hypothetical protein|nr:hypothetical protein [Prevotellaceae bacterium]